MCMYFVILMHADDTTLFCDITGTPADENLLILVLCKINDWLTANKNRNKNNFISIIKI